MKRQIVIEIECGETTCASEPGKFCRFLGRKAFGLRPVCMLFPDLDKEKGDAGSTPLEVATRWTQRCPQCLEAEGKKG